MNQELLEAWVEPQHVQVSINWPAKSGCMAGVCANVPQTTTQPLVCERGSVTDLCELNLQGPNNLQVRVLHSLLDCYIADTLSRSCVHAET